MAPAGERAKETLFAKCPKCSGSMSKEDKHDRCMYCLFTRKHAEEKCVICKEMPSRARKERATKVAARFGTPLPQKRPKEGKDKEDRPAKNSTY